MIKLEEFYCQACNIEIFIQHNHLHFPCDPFDNPIYIDILLVIMFLWHNDITPMFSYTPALSMILLQYPHYIPANADEKKEHVQQKSGNWLAWSLIALERKSGICSEICRGNKNLLPF